MQQVNHATVERRTEILLLEDFWESVYAMTQYNPRLWGCNYRTLILKDFISIFLLLLL